jgi:hypothetical protein
VVDVCNDGKISDVVQVHNDDNITNILMSRYFQPAIIGKYFSILWDVSSTTLIYECYNLGRHSDFIALAQITSFFPLLQTGAG